MKTFVDYDFVVEFKPTETDTVKLSFSLYKIDNAQFYKSFIFHILSYSVLNICKSYMIIWCNESVNVQSFKLLEILKHELNVLTSHNVIMFLPYE